MVVQHNLQAMNSNRMLGITQGTLSSWWVRIILSLLLCFFIVIQSVIASMKKKAK